MEVPMLPAYVTRPFRLYAVFRGRSTRREYWCFAAVALMGMLVALAVAEALERALSLGIATKDLMVLLYLAVVVALGVPGLAVKVRRLHDIGLSGWWLLIGFLPLVGGLIDLFFCLKPGDAGENRFGADPRATEPAADAPADVAAG
jgi:uncharacterized membrane protein YhaH (DUF805 family)